MKEAIENNEIIKNAETKNSVYCIHIIKVGIKVLV